jgi:predicted PolB exonuclease-like 3'-5' exonuclease
MNILVFDIETVPDTDTGRKLNHLEGLSDSDVAKVMFQKRREETGGSEFLPLHLHRIVAIAAVLRTHDKLKVWSLGEPDSTEEELLQRFFGGIERFMPTLVSWNGGAFDLPVMHYRALLHGVSAPRYWDTGENRTEFRWNNYLNRYHWRHTDLLDVLANYQPRGYAPLDQVATMLGFPGKMGMNGAQVWESFLAGDILSIRHYCETDVLNTYLLFLGFELLRGHLEQAEYHREHERVKQMLAKREQPHLRKFLEDVSCAPIT